MAIPTTSRGASTEQNTRKVASVNAEPSISTRTKLWWRAALSASRAKFRRARPSSIAKPNCVSFTETCESSFSAASRSRS